MVILFVVLAVTCAALAWSPIGIFGAYAITAPITPVMPIIDPDVHATITSPEDWMKYHSECRQYLLIMGQKFTTLLGQASVFSFGAMTAILTMTEKAKYGLPHNLCIAIPSAIGLFMYAAIIVKYFLQVRATGRLMARLEGAFLGRNQSELGLIHVLVASNGGFYGKRWTLWLTGVYVAILTVLPLVIALLLPTTAALRGTPQ